MWWWNEKEEEKKNIKERQIGYVQNKDCFRHFVRSVAINNKIGLEQVSKNPFGLQNCKGKAKKICEKKCMLKNVYK